MALVLGTNCGFVTTAPTADPTGQAQYTIDNSGRAVKVVTTDAITITEIGWYCPVATEESNYEVGIYSDKSTPSVPETLLEVSRTNAKGTDAGWKVVTGLNWALAASTSYWLAVQVDNTATTTTIDNQQNLSDSYIISQDTSLSTLPDTWVAASAYTKELLAIYAFYEAPAGTNMQVNIDDTMKDVSDDIVNIDDAWKTINSAIVNVDDNWKTIF